jgi:hypothetical protein
LQNLCVYYTANVRILVKWSLSNLAGSLAKTVWASLLPRQNSPKLAGPLCYLAKARQNLLGLFATSPKLAKTCWASLLPRQNSPKLAGPLCGGGEDVLSHCRANLSLGWSPEPRNCVWACPEMMTANNDIINCNLAPRVQQQSLTIMLHGQDEPK